MTISSRTPEGDPNWCSVCGRDLQVEPSTPPGDATCPHCGSLVWYRGVTGQLVPECGEPIALTKSEIQIGRRNTCDICLPSLKVSALHCVLTYGEGHWSIRDSGSKNGIKVNGKRVMLSELRPCDTITIAGSTYTIEYESPTESYAGSA
jgi:DNA-directed RNA polymerase subunit RPC12/RpoP